MTIAAGFAYDGGVVIAADTLISGGIVSAHQSKIGGYSFGDGKAIFAIAGHVDLAEATIQQCEQTLCEHHGPPRTTAQLAREIREALGQYIH